MKSSAFPPACAGLALLCGGALTAGCDYMLPEGVELGQHRVAVDQGNVLTEASIRSLHLGMDKKQVLFLLGTPLITDPFHPERWEYPLFAEATKTGEDSRLDLLSLRFEAGKLARVDRLVPVGQEAAGLAPRRAIEAEAASFDAGDARLRVDASPGEEPTPAAPAPDRIEEDASAGPEPAPDN